MSARIWRGLNRAVDTTQLEELYSPDCSNCAPRKGKVGVLGPRPGFSFVNAVQFSANVTGKIPLTLPRGDVDIIATSDGELFLDETPPADNARFVIGSDYNDVDQVGANGAVMNHPDTSFDATPFTFQGGTPSYDLTSSLYMKVRYEINCSVTGTGETFDVLIDTGTIVDGSYRWHNQMTVRLESLGGSNPSYFTYGDFVTHPGSGTITGLVMKGRLAGGWPASAQAGDTINLQGKVAG